MHPLSTLSAGKRALDSSTSTITSPFDDLVFLRLSAWEESRKMASLPGLTLCGDRIFARFEYAAAESITLDFWYRGEPVSQELASRFLTVLSKVGPVNTEELLPSLQVILGSISKPSNIVERAEVGPIKGRNTLAIWWFDSSSRHHYLSVFLDCYQDGKIIRELHFSAPQNQMEKFDRATNETLKTLQWQQFPPPPIFESSNRSA